MNMQETAPQFLSTAEAANMLGLSTTLIQSLVDKNELSAWKTRGGHRRIALQSILDYQTNAQLGRCLNGKSRSQPKIMVAVETPELMHNLVHESANWHFPFEFKFVDSITAALLDLAHERPDLLIVELAMPRQQQEKILNALLGFNAREQRTMSIALISAEHNRIAQPSHHASAVQVASGPLTPIWLHAFLTGVQASWRT
jgi:excisionase family DNA binding protein